MDSRHHQDKSCPEALADHCQTVVITNSNPQPSLTQPLRLTIGIVNENSPRAGMEGRYTGPKDRQGPLLHVGNQENF